jgi:phenylacetate-CoA ligase
MNSSTPLDRIHSDGSSWRSLRRPDPSQGARSFLDRKAARVLYATAYESVLYPTWQGAVRGRPVGAQRRVLARTQWMQRDDRDRMQLTSLRALLEHAAANVPYYRELFAKLKFDPRDVRSAADLVALPILTRDIVRERIDDLVDPATRGKNYASVTGAACASGATDVALRFEHCNQSEAWRRAVRLRSYGWAGYRLGMPAIHYAGRDVGPTGGLHGRKVRLHRALRREFHVDAANQDEGSLRSFAELVGRVRPHAIVAYARAIASFARWVAEQGARDWPDTHVIACAEALTPPDREAIASVFGHEVYETYGPRETMIIASECDAHDGQHIAEENVLVEVAREGRLVAPGTSGDVLVTDLHNFGMPFIRYANGDVATLAEDAVCPCGRTLRKLSRVGATAQS